VPDDGDVTQFTLFENFRSETHSAVTYKHVLEASTKLQSKAVPLHAMEALGGRGNIAPTPLPPGKGPIVQEAG
jgi:hypothetical protein